MSRATILTVFVAVTITGCTGRFSHEQAEPSGSSTTTVEIATLDSPPPIPVEAPPQPSFIELEGTGNIVVFGDVHHHHFHDAPEPSSVRVDVRLQLDRTDDRERRRRLVEQRLADLLDRHSSEIGEKI